MESFSTPSSVTTATTTIAITTTVSSSSNLCLTQAQQSMGHPQNVHFPNNNNSAPLGFPEPYFVPYDQNMRLPYMDSFPQMNEPIGYPLYSLPMRQSSVLYRMPNSELQGWSQLNEEDREMSRVARDKRKQARQRNRSSAIGTLTVPTRTIKEQPDTSGGSNVKVTVNQDRNSYVFCTPDGKRLEEILTKKLKNSDVSCLGRIVLPKREAEAKLPTLWDKEGIDVVLKDVYSELRWSLRYKYWSNNRSRMYVLDNTGDFVNHYGLQMGDSITLYKDEFENLYVSTKKQRNLEVSDPVSSTKIQHMNTPYTHQAKDEEEASLAVLIKELDHRREAKDANSFLTSGRSTSETEDDKIAQDLLPNNSTNDLGASSQLPSQTTLEAATSSFEGHTILINDDQQNNFYDVYGSLDNIFEIGCSDNLFYHLRDY